MGKRQVLLHNQLHFIHACIVPAVPSFPLPHPCFSRASLLLVAGPAASPLCLSVHRLLRTSTPLYHHTCRASPSAQQWSEPSRGWSAIIRKSTHRRYSRLDHHACQIELMHERERVERGEDGCWVKERRTNCSGRTWDENWDPRTAPGSCVCQETKLGASWWYRPPGGAGIAEAALRSASSRTTSPSATGWHKGWRRGAADRPPQWCRCRRTKAAAAAKPGGSTGHRGAPAAQSQLPQCRNSRNSGPKLWNRSMVWVTLWVFIALQVGNACRQGSLCGAHVQCSPQWVGWLWHVHERTRSGRHAAPLVCQRPLGRAGTRCRRAGGGHPPEPLVEGSKVFAALGLHRPHRQGVIGSG